jgi:hypothetical protein
MSSRKSSPDSHPLAPKTRRSAARSRELYAGDSETHFTPTELARIVDEVWEHGRVMPEADSAAWRQDQCGAWIMREHFGREDSEFGWKIERVALEGATKGSMLRPFNCRNGFDLANGRAHCGITADRTSVPAERQAGPPRNKRP